MSSEKYNPTLESVEKDKQLPNAWSARIQMHNSSATASNYEEKNVCVANLSDDVATALHSLPSLLSRSALTEVESSNLPSGALSIVNTIGLTNENTLHKDQASSITDATNKSEEGQSSNLNVHCSHLQGPGAISNKIDFFPKINEPGNSDMTLKNDQIRIGSLVDGTQHNEDLSSIAGALPCTSNLIRFEAIPDPSSRPSENVLETADCPKALSTWQDITSNSACFEAPTSRFGASVKSSVMGSVNDMPKSTNMKTLPNCFSEAGLGLDQREDCLPIPSSNLGIQSFVGNSNPNESLSRLRAAKSIPTEQCSFLSPQPTLHGAQVLLPVGPNGVDSVQKARTEPCCEVAVASSTTSKIILTSNSISNISSAAGNISLAVSNAISAAINTITAASNTSSAAGNTSSAVSSSLSSFSPEQVVCKGDLGTEALRATRADSQNIAAHAAADGQHQPLKAAVFNAKAGPVYNWQATLTTVKDRFAFLFNNEILSDVQFVVGRGEEEQVIPAHKLVLAVGSAVFDAMFNGQLASQQQVIHLPDVEPQAFLALLSFLYSDEVQIGPETVMTVLYTAKKYAVPALERRCVEFLKTNLSSDNAFMLLTQARLFDEPQLAALCLKTIDKCTAEAIVAEGFTDIDASTLTLVLQRDTLRIKELHLFRAVCRWAEAECIRQGLGVGGRQQRSVLGQALNLIRFPLMSVEEFAQGPAQSGILTDAEVVQLFLYFSVNPKPSVDFIDVPRCCMTGKEQTVCRFLCIESRWGYSGTPDRVRFIVDRRIFVVGFGMYGSIHGPSEFEVVIQLIHTLTGKVCGSNETVFTSDGSTNTFRVMFPDPIEVLPNTNYTAYTILKGPDSHYGTKGLRKVVVECPSGDRVCFQFSYAAGNNNGTSVEDGQIPEIIFHT